jgi:hypothetical protein
MRTETILTIGIIIVIVFGAPAGVLLLEVNFSFLLRFGSPFFDNRCRLNRRRDIEFHLRLELKPQLLRRRRKYILGRLNVHIHSPCGVIEAFKGNIH